MMIDRDITIELTGMEFHAFHGCLEQERKEGNTFVVDFRGKRDGKKAAKTDDLKNTADYSKIYEIVVAGRIVDAIMEADFGFWFVQVRVSKKNPPVGGACSWSRVTATWGKGLQNDIINESF